MRRTRFALPYIVWMIIFTVVPLIVAIFYALTTAGGSFTMSNFTKFFQPMYMSYLGRSLNMAFFSTLICLLVGYPAAYFLADRRVNKSAAALLLFVLPMWMNFLLRSYAWMSLLESEGLITHTVNSVRAMMGLKPIRMLYTYGAMLMGMVYNFLPFMVLPIYTVLSKMDKRLSEAAQDLGADNRQVFFRVTMPLSVPGVVSGVTMVFMPCMTTFVISQLLGGNNYNLFGDLIMQEFVTSYNWNFGSALSIIMMALILVSMGILNHYGSEDGVSAW